MTEKGNITTHSGGGTNPKSILEELHARCSQALASSLETRHEPLIGQSYLFLVDLDAWRGVLRDQPEAALYDIAGQEFTISLLNVCQGQYRNAFKSLRLVLELCLQGAFLSANLILRAEWLKGDIDTQWATLMDPNNGPLSTRHCRAFFPELSTHAANFREMARTTYSELSECIHGNVPNEIPLPTALGFDMDALELWYKKTELVRLIVLFALSVRYLTSMPEVNRAVIEASLLEQLGHIESVRLLFGGVATI